MVGCGGERGGDEVSGMVGRRWRGEGDDRKVRGWWWEERGWWEVKGGGEMLVRGMEGDGGEVGGER